MINNVQSLKSKAKQYSLDHSITINQVYQNFIFERFLERLSKSKYKHNFIIKGGCLLSSIMGVSTRTTMDIDTHFTGNAFSQAALLKAIKEILAIEIDDNVTFSFTKIVAIKEEQNYEGFRIYLEGVFFNLNLPFHIDVSTGDIITPNSINYSYKKLLENSYIDILAYNNETIIAEKLESILFLKNMNSRMKDYYDLYYFKQYLWNKVNIINLKQAILNTFTHRNSFDNLIHANEILLICSKDMRLNQYWEQYKNTNNFVKDISFVEVISSINDILSLVKNGTD